MEIYGWLFLIVCCGAFGRREIVGALMTSSVPCLTSSFYFSELYWTGSLCGGTILFLLFWIYLIFVMFVLDLFTLVYPLSTWVSLFFYQWIFFYLSKKKKEKNRMVERKIKTSNLNTPYWHPNNLIKANSTHFRSVNSVHKSVKRIFLPILRWTTKMKISMNPPTKPTHNLRHWRVPC